MTLAIKNNNYGFIFNDDEILEKLRDRRKQINKIMCKKTKKKSHTFTPIMTTIITIIDAAERDAKEMYKDDLFYGLTSTILQKIFSKYGINKNDLKEKIYYLVKLGFIDYNRYGDDTTYYYSINKDFFVCSDGFYSIYCDNVDSPYNHFMGGCEMYHFCDCNSKSCILHNMMKEKASMMANIPLYEDPIQKSETLQYIKNKINERIELDKEIHNYKIKITKLIGNSVEILTNTEIIKIYLKMKKIEDDDKFNDKNILYKKLKKSILDFIILNKTIPIDENTLFTKSLKYTVNYKRLSSRYDINKIEKLNTMGDSLDPLMGSVLTMMDFSRKYADNNGWNFPGLSMYQIQKLTGGFWNSNESVFENVNHLVRNNFILKFRYDKIQNTKKSNELCKYHYDANLNVFPCFYGYYLYNNEDPDLTYKLCNSVCEHHPFCNLKPESCKMIQIMEEKTKILLYPYNFEKRTTKTFFSNLKLKMKVWIKDSLHFKKYKKYLIDFLNDNKNYFSQYGDINILVSKMNDNEFIYYGKRLLSFNDTENYDYIKSETLDSLLDILRVDDAKKRKKSRRKKKVDTKKKDFIRNEILRQILDEPLNKKIKLKNKKN